VKDNNKKGQLKNDVDEEKNEDREKRSLEKLSFIVHLYPLVFKKTKECAIYQLDAARNNVNSLKPFKLGPVSGGKISFTLLRLVVGSVYTKLNQQKGEQQDTYLVGKHSQLFMSLKKTDKLLAPISSDVDLWENITIIRDQKEYKHKDDIPLCLTMGRKKLRITPGHRSMGYLIQKILNASKILLVVKTIRSYKCCLVL